jgi:hypothetical protein
VTPEQIEHFTLVLKGNIALFIGAVPPGNERFAAGRLRPAGPFGIGD